MRRYGYGFVLAAVLHGTAVHAQAAADRAPEAAQATRRGPEGVERVGETLRVRALGLPDERFRRVEARVASARGQAEARARRALSEYVVGRLGTSSLAPAALAALQLALETEATVATVRLRVDGSAEVELVLEVAAVERALGQGPLP